jgi:hypothetical protein
MQKTSQQRSKTNSSGWISVNSAFFADQPVTLSIAKMYEGLMERAMITVRVFEKREAAAEWLGVPLQILYPPSKKK